MIQQPRRDLTGAAGTGGGCSLAATIGLKPDAAHDRDKSVARAA